MSGAGGASTGRRIGPAIPRNPDPAAVTSALLVLVAAVAVLLAGSAGPTQTPAPSSVAVPVRHALHACPQSHEPSGSRSEVLTGIAPVPDAGGEGSVRYGVLRPGVRAGQPLALSRGDLVATETPQDDRATLVQAEGGLAAGLFSFHVLSDGQAGTLAITECRSPRPSWWFVGAGGTLDHSSVLRLANLDPGPAVVDVRVLGQTGELETVGTRGITVAPGTSTVLPLADVVPQSDDVAVHVRASRGRVVASVSDQFAAEPGAASGQEWIPGQDNPSRRQRLAGLPAGADAHTLTVANPSRREALVEVEVAGRSGSFTPTEHARVQVPPGSVTTVDLSDVLGPDEAAVLLASQVPVLASVRSMVDADTSVAGSVRPLAGPAAVPVPEGSSTAIMLSAEGGAATAVASAYDSSGREVTSRRIELLPQATAVWRPGRRAAYVVVTPERGRVFGAASVTDRSGTSQMRLGDLAIELERPVVRPALG
jgi:hypothetical protein